MANKVTAHSKIKVIRSEITVQTKELKNCYQNIYIKMKCNTVYSPYVTASIEITHNCLKRLEKTLCAAQQAATAIAGLTSKVPENTVSFSISPNRGSYPIDITVSDARACLDKMCNCKSAFDKISAGLDSCKSEISNLPVEDQTLNSVSVIETVFTGMYHGIFGGGSKVEIVKKAKQAFVNTMADAARIINELNAAITEFASKNGKLSKLLDEFETCEDKAFRQYEENFAKKYIDKTKQYTDSSLPDEAQLDNEITGLENAKNMLNSITCEECKDFDEEIIRLENLYENHYGFEGKINDLQKQEEFRDGEANPYNRYRPNYKGHIIPGASCYAIAAIFQYECTGQWAETNYVKINSINDVKAGDMLHYYGYNATGIDERGNQTGHWVFVYKVKEVNGVKKIYYAEGNAYDRDKNRVGVNNYGVLDAYSSDSMGTIRFSDVRRPNL